MTEPSGEATWGSDVPISLPEPLPVDPGAKVSFGGLAFITTGHVFDLTTVDRETMLDGGYGPPGGLNG